MLYHKVFKYSIQSNKRIATGYLLFKEEMSKLFFSLVEGWEQLLLFDGS